ncbi:MAG: alpha/beta hydrolase [Lachnospiraceae bacterium]|nr:alpha/beta hydrolase [Lachnospiraceae bacterium]
MNIEKFKAEGKEATLYHSKGSGSPLILLNNYAGDGKSVMEAAEQLEEKDFNLLCVGNLNWDQDMTPWDCPMISPKDTPCMGGADGYLKFLLEDILPECIKRVDGKPSHISIAGYSLAGLFALYALYHTDVFERAASISGSLWFPDFKEYVFSHEMKKKPEKLYLSLGDKEARTRNPYIQAVQENTESIVGHFRRTGIDVTFEMNPGNHFKNAALRSAKGILAII